MKYRHPKPKTAGLPPGVLVHTGRYSDENISIDLIRYSADTFTETAMQTIDDCKAYCKPNFVTWVNINGLHQVDIIERAGKLFDIHPLVLEDILNTNQRPKCEDFQHYSYIVIKMLIYNSDTHRIENEQVSIILGQSYVLSFQERKGDLFEPVRERLRKSKGRIRSMGPDYLTYALIDATVDHYFFMLEKIGEQIELLEINVIENPTPATLHAIHRLKREIIYLRKSIWPSREMIAALQQSTTSLISEEISVFLRDLNDHVSRVIESIETYRDMISVLLDIYLTTINNKMNEVMKVLTIIATLFIPLSFIAGLYGMNFVYMPELHWRWGYFAVLGVMALTAGAMLAYFKSKKWF